MKNGESNVQKASLTVRWMGWLVFQINMHNAKLETWQHSQIHRSSEFFIIIIEYLVYEYLDGIF